MSQQDRDFAAERFASRELERPDSDPQIQRALLGDPVEPESHTFWREVILWLAALIVLLLILGDGNGVM